jgi:stage V sporulation protein SpoVS
VLAGFAAGIHEVAHGNVIGIETKAYVLNVYNEDIEHIHGFLGGVVSAGAAVEGEDGNARDGFYSVGYVGTVIGQISEAVLRREDGADVDALGDEGVQNVSLSVANQTGLVAENGYSLAFQKGKVDFKLLVSQNDPAIGCTGAGGAYEAAENEDGGRHPANDVFHTAKLSPMWDICK